MEFACFYDPLGRLHTFVRMLDFWWVDFNVNPVPWMWVLAVGSCGLRLGLDNILNFHPMKFPIVALKDPASWSAILYSFLYVLLRFVELF